MEFDKRDGVPQCTLQQFERDFADRHLLHGVVAKWAVEKPDAPALIHHERKTVTTWQELERTSALLAMELLRVGFRKGDFLAASLPFTPEHIFLEYACFQIGVIHAPLDLRLKPPELLRCLELIRPKGFVFPGQTPTIDFRELGKAVETYCPYIEHVLQLSQLAEMIEGAKSSPESLATLDRVRPAVAETDGAQIIFTTGSTGSPKPALLSHRNITCQNLCLGAAFGFGENTRLLVNLPPFHVGGQAEALMTTMFWGGTAVALGVFDAARSLDAVREHGVNVLGQIPAMYNYEWRLADYTERSLGSLELAVYGGQQVPRPFLEKLAGMAPIIATGLGLTEAAGFCTFTSPEAGVDGVLSGIGHDMPVYPLSIREPMREDGSAGAELPAGETGHICFRGPQTFLGYVNDLEATRRTVSSDGYLYTGDLGFADARGLHFAARARWVIKPAGHQVFPGDVENHVCGLEEKVAACAAVGVEHRLLTEAIVAFVEKKPGIELTVAELRRRGLKLTSYMRPLHYVLLEAGQMPLNRAAKSDYVRLREMAVAEVERLRTGGGWDC